MYHHYMFDSAIFFFSCYGCHLDLHVLTHSFPTRRSSDLERAAHRFDVGAAQAVAGDDVAAVTVIIAEIDRDLGRELAVGEARSEEHTSKLQSLMRISYAVFCLKKKNKRK